MTITHILLFLILLALVSGLARVLGVFVLYRRNAKRIVTGVCETDYSGYPDCRDDTIKAMQLAINLGMQARFVIQNLLMSMDKSETWVLTKRLGGKNLVDLVRSETHTCYHGDCDHFYEWRFGCGIWPTCELRAKGRSRFRSLVVENETVDASQ
jgi:7-cyano-7-deazaguanine synthase